MRDHPYRQSIRDEVHARPVVMIPAACRLRRLVFLPGPGDPGVPESLAALADWCAASGRPVPPAHARQHSFGRADGALFGVTFEFHNEFVTLSWSAPPEDEAAFPDDIGLEVLGNLPLVSATAIDVRAAASVDDAVLARSKLSSLCHVGIEGGKAEIATDLIEDRDGFVHFDFAAGALTPLRRSILARRLMEIETYSRLALVGLPPVRAIGPDLTSLEAEVSDLLNRLPEIDELDEARAAITALNTLAQRVMVLNDRLNYRIAASQAYGEIVANRLKTLGDLSTGKGSNISVYIDNRVGPALRTLASAEKRLQSASRRIERAAVMLNVRNGLELEMHNREILGTISKTARSQFRLQQTVEGLSVIAITYYLVGILGYALAGPIHALDWDKEWVMAALTPLALVLVFVSSRLLWGRHKE